jgi:hypothetical protein
LPAVGADIERWSDRFKPKPTSAATVHAALRGVHASRQWDKDLLPPSVFEAVLEKKPKAKATKSAFFSLSSSQSQWPPALPVATVRIG